MRYAKRSAKGCAAKLLGARIPTMDLLEDLFLLAAGAAFWIVVDLMLASML